MSSNVSESAADDLRKQARAWLTEHWSGDPNAATAPLPDGSSQSFVEKVIDEDDKVEIKDSSKDGGGMAMLQRRFDFDPLMLIGIGAGAVVLGLAAFTYATRKEPGGKPPQP